MCGIAGVLSYNSKVDKRFIISMNYALRHRGPDDEGYIAVSLKDNIVHSLNGNDSVNKSNLINDFNIEANLFLGHRRLSIIDPSPAGHQPMSDETRRVWIVYNGEIYNYLELREELKQKGFKFTTNTDTEVLLKSYIEWGTDCVNRFNGMWAFAILDLGKSTLFLSRDRFGVKPLYFYKDENYFAFASEIKALLTVSFIKREVNYEAVFDYLAFGWEEEGEDSFFSGIRELKSSHNMIVNLNNREVKLYQYYELSYFDKFEKYNLDKESQHVLRVRELIFNAVRLRLRSDVKVGSCLSGGVDSSTIVCVMNEIIKNEKVSQVGDFIKCFTASYTDDKVDESNWAKVVIENTNSEWIRTFPTEKELLEDLQDLIYTQEIPFGSTSIYAQYRVMKIASESGVKVLLDGQGGDELFTGYTGYFPTFYRELIKNLDFRGLCNEIKNVGASPIDLKTILNMAVKSELAKYLTFPKLRNFLIKRMVYQIFLINPEFYNNFSYRVKSRQEKIANSLNEQLYQLITGDNLKKLLRYEDRNSMRFSLESRTPFADDVNLIEYCFQIPSIYKIHNGYSKYILRQSMIGILPEQIRNRVDKVGFATPEIKWLKVNKEFVKEILSSSQILKNIVCTQNLLKDLDNDTIFNYGFTLWRVVNLAIWYDLFFKR